jgi:hypothetical protein
VCAPSLLGSTDFDRGQVSAGEFVVGCGVWPRALREAGDDLGQSAFLVRLGG